jgi:acyl-CoA thioesterase-1
MIDKQVLFFGDSHVAGVGDEAGLGWVGRVAAASFDAGRPFIPYNLGVGGDTSVDVLTRWQIEAQPRLRALMKSRVVFSFGVNDTTLEDERPRVEGERSLGALGKALERADDLGLTALVVGPAPVDDEDQNERIAALSQGFAAICADKSAPFVDIVGELRNSPVWREEVATDDGAHPGAAGYELLAELVLAEGWLEWLIGP